MSLITAIVIVGALILLFSFQSNIIKYYTINNAKILYHLDIYQISINIYIFFITIIFTLIGFSINKISKYNLTTKDFIKYLSYFGGILIYFIILTILNIIYNFNCYIFPYNFISYILLITGFLVFFSLIFFTIDTFQSENLFDFISKDTKSFIKKYKKEDKKHNKLMKMLFKNAGGEVDKNVKKVKENFNEELNIKINILFENLISAINKNDFLVSKKILEEIPNITQVYLEETKEFFFKDDEKFAYNLNDNYNFVFDSIKNSYNEKLYEHLVNSISNSSMCFLENRELLGLDSGYSIHFLASLENFFYKTFKLKRTSVCHSIVQAISKHILFYDKIYNSYHNPYVHYLDQIENFLKLIIKLEAEKKGLFEESHDYWANMIYRNIIIAKRKRYLIFLVKILEFKYVNDQLYNLQHYFKNFSGNLIEIKKNSRHLSIIYPCIFGIDSFVIEIAKLGLVQLNNDVQRINLSNYIREYLKFNKEIILNYFEKNDSFVYQFYPEFVFYIIHYVDLKKEDKDKLIEDMFDIVFENIDMIIKKEENDRNEVTHSYKTYSYSELKGKLIDSIAILLHSHKEHSVATSNIISKLLKFYSNLKKNQKDDLFSVMKLIGCWINYSVKVDKRIIKSFNNTIKNNLRTLMKEREDIISKAIGTTFQEYGYFDSSFSTYHDGYWLHPSYLWGNQFQDKISKLFNSDLTIYEKYHKNLKKLKSN